MSSDTYEVTLIREGFEKDADNGQIIRQCNTVLVRGPIGILLVNPGSPWDGPHLLEALKNHNVPDPSAIKYVVCTDGKASHVGCLSLFSNAEMIIVGHDIQKPGNLFVQHDFTDGNVPFEFDENLSVIGTPGLMDQQVTVFVKGVITPHTSFSDEVPKHPVSIAITGSIFNDADDAIRTGVFHGNFIPADFAGDCNSSLTVWRQSRDRLLEKSDWIFPAFGGAFKSMFSKFHYKVAKGLRSPDLNFTSSLLRAFVFKYVNRPMNRYAVEMCDLRRGQKVLDIGSGVGYGVRYALDLVAPHTVLRLRFDLPTRVFGPQWFRRLGFIPIKVTTEMDKDGIVYGIDISTEMVSYSRTRLRPFIKANRAEVVQASINHIPLRNSSVDAVFHVESVYFWPSLAEGLREILRVLKPGGVVVTTFNSRLIDRYVRWGWMRFGRPDHLAYAIALEQLGFEDVEWIRNDPRAPRGVQCIRARKPSLGLLTE